MDCMLPTSIGSYLTEHFAVLEPQNKEMTTFMKFSSVVQGISEISSRGQMKVLLHFIIGPCLKRVAVFCVSVAGKARN